MSEPSSRDPRGRNPMGGGAPIALLTLGGVLVGGLLGQPSLGLLVGLALGVVIAILLWRLGSR